MALNLKSAVTELDQEIAKLQRVRAVLAEVSHNGSVPRIRRGKREMSSAARKRIAAAQRARWAKWRKENS